MKGIYLVAIAAVFLASWSAIDAKKKKCDHKIPTKCPKVDRNDTTTHLAHKTDCTKFYMCLAGNKIERDCPDMNENGDKLHFNPCLEVCDWPWSAGCEDDDVDEDPIKEKNESEDKTHDGEILKKCPECDHKIPTKCPKVDPNDTTIHLAHRTDCTKFYMCLAGMEIEKDCPLMNKKGDRLHFNPCLQVCDWPGHCCLRGGGDEEECTDNDGLLLRDPEDCSRYFECSDGDKEARECPDDTYFNEEEQACVDYPNPSCDNPRQTVNCTEPGELVPHECDCNLYYKCREDDRVRRKCDDGLDFSPTERKCMDPEKAGCRDLGTSCLGCCEKREPWVHGCDERLYYTCEFGWKEVHACPWGYKFDEDEGLCKCKSKCKGKDE